MTYDIYIEVYYCISKYYKHINLHINDIKMTKK